MSSFVSQKNYQSWSKDQLIQELSRVSNEFGLRWDTSQADRDFEKERRTNLVVMDHVPAHSKGPAPFENLLIEGDNFDALRYLSVTHRGRINCIYIDPPYNTGNEDFIYVDNFLDAKASFRHSKWLAFMNARMQLARELLAPDGVILVSIDDNEYHHLKMLMDQVFAGMYQATFVWKRRSGSNDAKGAFVSTDHEYVLCYAGKGFSFAGVAKDFSNYSNPDQDKRGPWTSGDLSGNKPGGDIYYSIVDPETGIHYFPPKGRYWTCNPAKTLSRIDAKKILFPADASFVVYATLEELKKAVHEGTAPGGLRLDYHKTSADSDAFALALVGKKLGLRTPTYKRHLSEVKRAEKPLSTWVIPSSEKTPAESEEVEFLSWGFTAEGTKLIQDMLGTKAFNYPKPLSLVKALIEQATAPGDLVLDFFGGSATTGHAVLALNAENDNQEPRRFIVVSAAESTKKEPEKNICKDVSSPRLKAAIEGYSVRTKNGVVATEGVGGSFAYLRARVVPVAQVPVELQDAQIWHALQLNFGDALCPFNPKVEVQTAATEQGVVAYCPNPTKALNRIESLSSEHGSVLLFARKLSKPTSAALATLENVTAHTVPQELLNMFGVTE